MIYTYKIQKKIKIKGLELAQMAYSYKTGPAGNFERNLLIDSPP
jgi:hypothetical protein